MGSLGPGNGIFWESNPEPKPVISTWQIQMPSDSACCQMNLVFVLINTSYRLHMHTAAVGKMPQYPWQYYGKSYNIWKELLTNINHNNLQIVLYNVYTFCTPTVKCFCIYNFTKMHWPQMPLGDLTMLPLTLLGVKLTCLTML